MKNIPPQKKKETPNGGEEKEAVKGKAKRSF